MTCTLAQYFCIVIKFVKSLSFICSLKLRTMVRSTVDNLLSAEDRVLDEIGESSPTATRYAIC